MSPSKTHTSSRTHTSSKSRKSPKTRKSSKTSRTHKSSKVNQAIVHALDARAAAFGISLTHSAHVILTGYIVACTAKIISILVVLAGHCSKHAIDMKDVTHLRILSELFLSVTTIPTSKTGQQQQGGAETTMASEFFSGVNSGAYFPTDTLSHGMTSTPAFIRPVLPVSLSYDIPPDSISSNWVGLGQVGGGIDLSTLDRPAFLEILSNPMVPKHPAIKDDAEVAIRCIIGCNLMYLMASIRRVKKPSAIVIKKAIKKSSFVIPV